MAERNPFLEVKTIVEPTARPVDTYVQPAPVSDRKIKELGAFIDNMLPRINRFAGVEIQRKEKKDVGKVLSKLSIPSQSTNSSYLRTKIY